MSSTSSNANASGSKQATPTPIFSAKELKRQAEREAKKKAKKEFEKANSTSTVIDAKTADGKKAKAIDKTLEKAKEDIKKEPKETKESNYKFPADCTEPGQRKTFRRNARARKASFENQITKLSLSGTKEDKQKLKEVEAEFEKWAADTYVSVPPISNN